VVVGQAEGVALAVDGHGVALEDEAAFGEGDGLAGVVHKVGAEAPALVQGVGTDDGQVVAAVGFGGVPVVVVDDGDAALGLAEGVADPAGELAGVLFHIPLGAVAAAHTLAQLRLYVGAEGDVGTVAQVQLVVHVLVIDFHAGLVIVSLGATEVAVVAQGILVGGLGADVGAAGNPEVGGEAGAGVAGDVDVLVSAVVAGFDAADLVEQVA